MVEVYGEGILILGDSGVGKSETAIELMKRGHRLIADDAVEIRKVSSKTLVGSSPDNIRHFIELRGIGIVNARNIFGIGSVKVTEKIDMVICLENLISTDFINSIDGLIYFIERFNSKNLGICLDTGHLNLNDRDQVAFIRKAGKHIKALHLADNDQSRDQHLMPYGCGSVDFVSVIREMKALDYKGLYNLEIPGERCAPLEVLGYKLDYLKNVLEYLDRVTE